MHKVVYKTSNDLDMKIANLEDINKIYNLYVERVNWFRENNIKQWDNYLDLHPLEEFIDIVLNKRLYVVTKESEIVGAFEIKYINQDFWSDDNNKTIYIKKLISKIGEKNIGNYVINYIKDLATYQKLKSIRLECEANNIKLNKIYDEQGFKFVGYVYKNDIKYSLREYTL